MFRMQWNRTKPTDPLLTTDWQWLIRLAWGKRRVSSRAEQGTLAYPRQVTATVGLWRIWARRTRRLRYDYVVITADRAEHGLNYAREMTERELQTEKETLKTAILARMDVLQLQRNQARANRNFELADRIRAEIEAAGFKVSDGKID